MNNHTLKIILLSDIHCSQENVVTVSNYIKQCQPPIDYIFLSGDYLNLPNKDPQQFQDKKANELHEQEIKDLLEQIQFLNIDTYYIPGNHDPLSMFQKEHKSWYPNFYNTHKKIHKLTDGLQILGFGGSVPAYLQEKQIWNGFPFNNDLEYQNEFKQLSEAFNDTPSNMMTIVMTHVGPSISGTTQTYQKDLQIIESGSKNLSEFLKSNAARIVVNIHGHTHEGHGYRSINGLKVVNAGALLWKNFAIIELRKNDSDNWELQNTSLLTL